MRERVRCGPGPPFAIVMLAFVRARWSSACSAQADSVLSWLSLGVALGAAAGAPSILLECTSPMTRPPRSVVQDGSAGRHPVSRDEGQARFQEAAFAIRGSRGKECAPTCSAESSAPPHPG